MAAELAWTIVLVAATTSVQARKRCTAHLVGGGMDESMGSVVDAGDTFEDERKDYLEAPVK